jgi:PKD repeat protein
MKRLFIFSFLISFSWFVHAQISIPASPASSKTDLKIAVPFVQIAAKVKPVIQSKQPKEPQPLLAGFVIPVESNIQKQGVWSQTSDDTLIWRMGIQIQDAEGINLSFSNFELAAGDKLFLYSPDQKHLLGAYTSLNNAAVFATEYIPGNQIIIEYNTRQTNKQLPFILHDVGKMTKIPQYGFKDFGDAGSCEIPVNCVEGDQFKNQKKGVARILLKEGGAWYWCTGSLINDTKNDGKPYFLTANHCGENASASEYAQWIFYFNYESPDCSRPTIEPIHQSVTGSKLLASALNNTDLGSDFKLLLLDTIPLSYKPYFNGWDRSGNGSPHGVVIHHPQGDIKMISTYSTPLKASAYYGSSDPDGLYWTVNWAATQTGHGVTEGGSSGSPLFSNEGLIVGTLTGGDAACNNQSAPDYFGRFSKHWQSNGSLASRQLMPWLDEAQTNVEKMPGYDPLLQEAVAEFTADVQTVSIGNSVQFTNLSAGPITAYHWEFEGGSPATSTLKTPPLIRYDEIGNYQVRLEVTYSGGTKAQVKDNFIQVRSVIFPNPTNDGKIRILLGSYQPEDIAVAVYNALGQPLNTFTPQFDRNSVHIPLPHNQNGIYFVRLTRKGESQLYKVLNFHR